jgi:hypothetical protein
MLPTSRALLTVAMQLAIALPAAAQIGVSPPRFEIDVDGRMTTHSLRVLNLGSRTTEVAVSVANWDLDESNEVRLLPPTEQSLDQWLVVNPLRFTISPGRSQTVRFAVRPKVEPEPGEHRAMLYLDETTSDDEGAAASLRTRFRLGIAVYAHVGETDRRGRVHGVDADGRRLLFDLESLGTSHLRLDGRFAVWPQSNAEPPLHTLRLPPAEDGTIPTPPGSLLVGRLPTTPILPATRRTLLLQLPPTLDEGRYVVAVVGHFGGEEIELTVPLSLTVPSPQTATTAPETD